MIAAPQITVKIVKRVQLRAQLSTWMALLCTGGVLQKINSPPTEEKKEVVVVEKGNAEEVKERRRWARGVRCEEGEGEGDGGG